MLIRFEDDLLSMLPLYKAKGACPHGRTGKAAPPALNLLLRDYSEVRQAQNANERSKGFGKRDLHRVALNSSNAVERLRCASQERRCAAHPVQKPGTSSTNVRIQEP